MKKENKFKLIVTILIGTLILLPTNIYAYNATVRWSSSSPIKGYYRLEYGTGKPLDAWDNYFYLNIGNGQNISAYCPDPGLTMHGGYQPTQATCSDNNLNDIQRTALSILFERHSGSHWKLQEAIRRLARFNGMNFYSAGVASNLMPDTTSDIKEAQSWAEEAYGIAINNPRDYSFLGKASGSLSSNPAISMSEKSHDGQNYIIQVTTNLKFEDIKFTCGSGCSATPNASDKTVSVTLKEGKCNFTLKASYGNDGTGSTTLQNRPVLCRTQGLGNQNMIIFTIMLKITIFIVI